MAALPGILVETDWLAAELGADDLRIYDCTTHLRPAVGALYRIESGREDYDSGHIPGADFLDLQGELSDASSSLRFMLPGADQFAAAVGRHGLGDGARVVLYSTGSPQWATRIWWMLRAFGFDNAAVLNGGFARWQEEGRPISTAPAAYPAATFTPAPREGLFLDKDAVREALDNEGDVIVNALAPAMYRGDVEQHYGRPGHIAGSVNVPAPHLLERDSGLYRTPEALRTLFEAAGLQADKRAVIYCGGGIAATADAFALSLLGHEDIAVYDASLSEWAQDASCPMETET